MPGAHYSIAVGNFIPFREFYDHTFCYEIFEKNMRASVFNLYIYWGRKEAIKLCNNYIHTSDITNSYKHVIFRNIFFYNSFLKDAYLSSLLLN